jgi:cytochrome P450
MSTTLPAQAPTMPVTSLLNMIIQIMQIRRGNLETVRRAMTRKGRYLRTGAGPFRIIFVNDPDGIQELLVKSHRHYKKDQGYESLRRVLGNGLLTSEGAFHLKQRRMIQPAFHKQRIHDYGQTMVQYSLDHMKAWRDGDECDINAEMMAVTLAIIGKTMFNAEVSGDAEKVSHALEIYFKYQERYMLPGVGAFFDALPLNSTRQFKAAIQDLNDTMYRIIREHRESDAHQGDLLTMLLEAQDEDDGARMSDDQLRDEAITLFLAGHETTAIALTWTWYLLSENPDVEARLHQELEEVLQGRPATADDVPKLDYTRRVFAESMRLYPPAYGFGREAVEDHVLAGYRVEKGDTVVVCPYITHRDPEYFPEPEKFDPDRWLPERAKDSHKYAYYPFGGGVRKCIGEPFAWMEGILLIATYAQHWTFRHVPSHKVGLDPKVTLRPKNGMRMTLHAR